MEENNYTEINEPTSPEATPLIIGDDIKDFLTETVKWGKFIAIIGFVFTALVGVIGLGMMVFGSAITASLPAGSFMGGFLGFIYLLMGLLYYFPSKYLYDFATYIKQALLLNDQESLAYGFRRLKALFRFWGILMIVLLIFYALMIVFLIGMAIFAGSLTGGQHI